MGKPEIKLLAWNANGGIRRKTSELIHLVHSQSIDIVLLNETHLVPSDSWSIPGFTIFRNDRLSASKRTRGGGTAILARSTATAVQNPTPNLTTIEATIVTFTTAAGPMQCIAAYSRPNTPFSEPDLDKLLLTSNLPTILAGDLNAKHPLWNSVSTNSRGLALLKYVTSSSSNLTVTGPIEPTYYHFMVKTPPDVLDIAILRNILTSYDITTIQALTSDHNPILMTIGNKMVNTPTSPRFSYAKADWQRFRAHIHNRLTAAPLPLLETQDDINIAISFLSALIRQAATVAIPKSIPITSNHLALSPALRACIREKNKARRRWQSYRTLDTKLEYNRLQRALDKDILLHRNTQWESKLSTLSYKDNSIWRLARTLQKTKVPNPPLLSPAGWALSSDAKAEAMANFLEMTFIPNPPVVGTPDLDRNVERLINSRQPPDLPPESKLEPLELRNIFANLNPRKAPGPDGIGAVLIRQLPGSAVAVLFHIYQQCLSLSYFPYQWKLAKIMSILKPGKPSSDPASYRPISLLNVLAKMFETIILNRIKQHLSLRPIIPPFQFGFVSHTSTEHQLLRLTNRITHGFNTKQVTAVAFLDIARAFDTVWHAGLIFKLVKFKFPRHLIYLLHSFLHQRKFQSSWLNTLSSPRLIRAGVPQGSVLSPTLFNIYTADMPRMPPGVDIHLFADDDAVAASSRSSQLAVKRLQSGLDILAPWYSLWRFSINASKTSATLFTTGRLLKYHPLTFDDVPIQWSTTNKYLGLLLDRHLNWGPHITMVRNKARNKLFALRGMLRSTNISEVDRLRIYTAIIRPTFLYASPIWGSAAISHLRKLQYIQNTTLRITLRLPKSTPLVPLHNSLDLPWVDSLIQERARSFYQSLDNHSNPLVRNQLQFLPSSHDRFPRPIASIGSRDALPQRGAKRHRQRVPLNVKKKRENQDLSHT